ncbi:MAG: NADH-quinone oxidoreductase subunit NuoE [Actinomycetota bacterium]|nr:NADH-quinone oxidoreductase subunit NuoE [Actinomycetota bacterium]
MPLTDQTRSRAREIIARYPQSRSALLPMLHLVQSEEGFVSSDGVALCADELGLTKAEVGAVATFYTMYKRRPAGDWLVSVCTNLSCQLLGAEEVFARLSRHLGVGHDQTTEDGTITLEHAECLAACDFAPVLTVNYEFYDNVSPDSALGIVEGLQRGERPHPSRGAPLTTFKEIEAELAGFGSPPPGKAPAREAPPESTDFRGTVDLAGTDVAPPAGQGYGVPGGVTERELTPQDAAATYTTGAADAGRSGYTQMPSSRRDEESGSQQEEPGDDPGVQAHGTSVTSPDPAPGTSEEGVRDTFRPHVPELDPRPEASTEGSPEDSTDPKTGSA